MAFCGPDQFRSKGLCKTSRRLASRDANWMCECGAPKVLLCFMHCWHAVERRQAKAYCFLVVASAEEYSSVRVHVDGKPPDGNAIAFVVIILLSIIALEVLFSRLDTFL